MCGCSSSPLPHTLPVRPLKISNKMCLKCCLQEPRTVLLALMLQRVLSAKGWGLLLSRRLASAVSVYPTPNEYAYKFVLPRRIAVNGCSVDLRSRDSFQPHRLDDVVAQVQPPVVFTHTMYIRARIKLPQTSHLAPCRLPVPYSLFRL